MTWKTVRLELAPTAQFPRGSTGRAFLLNVPIDANGCIDRALVEHEPSRATVRRFWACEPDCFGVVESCDGSWALRCSRENDGLATFLLDPAPISLNSKINVRSADGTTMPFRVVSIRTLRTRQSAL